ncbi:MAG TPA: hypothetical protein VIM19_08295 [Actinomycetes bacterium]
MRTVEASPGARVSALAVDTLLLGVIGLGVLLLSLVASTPWWNNNGQQGEGAGAALYSLNKAVPTWFGWATLVAIALLAVALSGALSRSGPRASTGLKYAELRLVRAGVAKDADPDLPPRVEEDAAQPARWQVAVRWLAPLVVFALVSALTDGLVGLVVALAGWAFAVVPGRRSLYDRLAGVTVVSAGWAEWRRPRSRVGSEA